MKIILISSDSCSSCMAWKPTLMKLADEFKTDVRILDYNDAKQRYKVDGIPVTILLDDDERELNRILGNMDEEIARKTFKYYDTRTT